MGRGIADRNGLRTLRPETQESSNPVVQNRVRGKNPTPDLRKRSVTRPREHSSLQTEDRECQLREHDGQQVSDFV